MNDIHHIYRHRQYDNIHSWSSPPLLISCLLFHQGKMQHVIIISQLIKSACPHLSRQGSLSNLKSLAYHRGLHYFSAYQIGLPPFVTTNSLSNLKSSAYHHRGSWWLWLACHLSHHLIEGAQHPLHISQ
jgi:hypothetical protein